MMSGGEWGRIYNGISCSESAFQNRGAFIAKS